MMKKNLWKIVNNIKIIYCIYIIDKIEYGQTTRTMSSINMTLQQVNTPSWLHLRAKLGICTSHHATTTTPSLHARVRHSRTPYSTVTMGGRQSSQNNSSVRAPATRSAQSPSRLSVSSLDATNPGRSHALNMNNGVLIRGRLPTDVSGSSPIERVQRRRRRRDRNDHFIEAHSLPAHLFPTFLTGKTFMKTK